MFTAASTIATSPTTSATSLSVEPVTDPAPTEQLDLPYDQEADQ
jgi:hypothetical protein